MSEIDSHILSTLLLLQSTIHVMQDDDSMARFVSRGISSIPGIHSNSILIRENYFTEIENFSPNREECLKLYEFMRSTSHNQSACDEYILKFKTYHNKECLFIRTIFNIYGFLFLKIIDKDYFNKIKPYIDNTLNVAALIIENNLQNKLLLDNQKNLEKKVENRTQKLIESEERFRALAQSSRDGIIVYDKDTKYLFWNKTMEKMTGMKSKNVLGKSHFEIFPFLKNIDEENIIRNILKGKATFMAPRQYNIPESGRKGWFVSSHYPIYTADEKIKGGLGIIHDITEQRIAEEEKKIMMTQLHQAQKMEAIGTLAGGIAHDFNNILSIIIMHNELALDMVSKDSQIHTFLTKSINASLRARDLIAQILNFSRKSNPKMESLPIVPLINESLKLIRASIPTTIHISESIQNISEMVNCNPTQINQILLNFCTNACQAMKNEGELSITLEKTFINENENQNSWEIKSGNYVVLSVSDTGCGINQEYLEKIFDPYFTTKEVGKGTGLGLSVVYGIVKLFNGMIKVKSEVNKGTTFYVYLPVVENEIKEVAETEKTAHGGNETILFIDDEEFLVVAAQLLISSLGYKVVCMTDPLKAIEYFRSHPDHFSLVITDMTMPHLSGNKLSIELLKIRPDIPIILCSGYNEMNDQDIIEKTGIKKFLMKPITKNDLAQAIRKVLDNKTKDFS